jgi:hypothetical protein
MEPPDRGEVDRTALFQEIRPQCESNCDFLKRVRQIDYSIISKSIGTIIRGFIAVSKRAIARFNPYKKVHVPSKGKKKATKKKQKRRAQLPDTFQHYNQPNIEVNHDNIDAIINGLQSPSGLDGGIAAIDSMFSFQPNGTYSNNFDFAPPSSLSASTPQRNADLNDPFLFSTQRQSPGPFDALEEPVSSVDLEDSHLTTTASAPLYEPVVQTVMSEFSDLPFRAQERSDQGVSDDHRVDVDTTEASFTYHQPLPSLPSHRPPVIHDSHYKPGQFICSNDSDDEYEDNDASGFLASSPPLIGSSGNFNISIAVC